MISISSLIQVTQLRTCTLGRWLALTGANTVLFVIRFVFELYYEVWLLLEKPKTKNGVTYHLWRKSSTNLQSQSTKQSGETTRPRQQRHEADHEQTKAEVPWGVMMLQMDSMSWLIRRHKWSLWHEDSILWPSPEHPKEGNAINVEGEKNLDSEAHIGLSFTVKHCLYLLNYFLPHYNSWLILCLNSHWVGRILTGLSYRISYLPGLILFHLTYLLNTNTPNYSHSFFLCVHAILSCSHLWLCLLLCEYQPAPNSTIPRPITSPCFNYCSKVIHL